MISKYVSAAKFCDLFRRQKGYYETITAAIRQELFSRGLF